VQVNHDHINELNHDRKYVKILTAYFALSNIDEQGDRQARLGARIPAPTEKDFKGEQALSSHAQSARGLG